MFKRIFAAALVFGAAALAPPLATAEPANTILAQASQVACATRAQVTEHLKQKFGETRRSAGLVDSRQILEVWRSDETGSWTILMTRADGVSCIVAAGSAWHDAIPQIASGGTV